MRGLASIIIVFLVAVVVLLLYSFLGKARLSLAVDEAEANNEALTGRLEIIRVMQREIPRLKEMLPIWQEQLEAYRTAIPSQIEDDVFFSAVADQLNEQSVQLLGVEILPGGIWLRDITEEETERLEAMGIDVGTARQIQMANYSINLIGDFDRVVMAFESLKKYGRLYTMDKVISPAGGGAGAIMQTVSQQSMPIMVSGRIYYGIPESYMAAAELIELYAMSMASPLGFTAQRSISNRAGLLLEELFDRAPAGDEEPEEPGDNENETEKGV